MIRVGITTLKLANTVSKKAHRRRTGHLEPIVCEALEERWGSDPDIRRDLTRNNIIEGIHSGRELAKTITAIADDYSQKRKAEGRRGLRKDASIGFACIVKPHQNDFSKIRDDDDKIRFLNDSRDFLDGVFGKSSLSSVIHMDEECPHMHLFYDGLTADGELSVDKLVNPVNWKRINTEYADFMAAKGWEIQPPDTLDETRKNDAKYMEERNLRHRKHGRPSKRYKVEATYDQMTKDRSELITREIALEEKETELTERETQLNADQAKLDAQRQAFEDEKNKHDLRVKQDENASNERKTALDEQQDNLDAQKQQYFSDKSRLDADQAKYNRDKQAFEDEKRRLRTLLDDPNEYVREHERLERKYDALKKENEEQKNMIDRLKDWFFDMIDRVLSLVSVDRYDKSPNYPGFSNGHFKALKRVFDGTLTDIGYNIHDNDFLECAEQLEKLDREDLEDTLDQNMGGSVRDILEDELEYEAEY